MTLALAEFVRRFCLHVLPERFVKIRHYGLLGNRQRQARLRGRGRSWASRRPPWRPRHQPSPPPPTEPRLTVSCIAVPWP